MAPQRHPASLLECTLRCVASQAKDYRIFFSVFQKLLTCTPWAHPSFSRENGRRNLQRQGDVQIRSDAKTLSRVRNESCLFPRFSCFSGSPFWTVIDTVSSVRLGILSHFGRWTVCWRSGDWRFPIHRVPFVLLFFSFFSFFLDLSFFGCFFSSFLLRRTARSVVDVLARLAQTICCDVEQNYANSYQLARQDCAPLRRNPGQM